MSQIFSSEVFKLRKSRVIIVTSLVVAGFATFVGFMTVLFNAMIAEIDIFEAVMGGGMDAAEMMGIASLWELFAREGHLALAAAFLNNYSVVVICAAVLAGIIICDEFDGGTIRNLLSAGKSRVHYYFVKLVCVFAVSLIFAALSTIIYAGLITVFSGFGTPAPSFWVNLLMLFGGQALIYLAFASLFVAAAFIFRSIGVTLAVVIGSVGFLEPLIVPLFTMEFMSNVRFLQNLFPYYNLLQFNNAFHGHATTTEYLLAAAMCALLIAASTTIGAVTFVKRDVK